MSHSHLEDILRDFDWGRPMEPGDTGWLGDLADHIARGLWGNAPVHMDAQDLSALLLRMSQLVEIRDSFDGSISYEMSERTEQEYDVTAAYRYGNAQHGQGFMALVRGDL